ncbi:hypothetical protein TcasGA2_TC010834 [Tribolium castaneum]|uniref:Uncharacterized protein n=1 Tax=Tribolium castaneum TaxID=7070 RepID=D6W7H9_TRICA|nr:hypothetical protein TcasGA2_TC010834 [Tribolium castaneum]
MAQQLQKPRPPPLPPPLAPPPLSFADVYSSQPVLDKSCWRTKQSPRVQSVVADRCRSTEGVVKIAQSPPGWYEKFIVPPSRESEFDGRGPQYNYSFYSIS